MSLQSDTAATAVPTAAVVLEASSPGTLSRRATTLLRDGPPNSMRRDGAHIRANAYDPVKNPNGIVMFGTAVNTLMSQEILQKLKASLQCGPEDLFYGPATGRPRIQQAVSKLVNRYFHPCIPVEPAHIMLLNGAGSAITSFAWAFCDEGEALLVPGPDYGGFALDVALHSRVKVVSVPVPTVELQSISQIRHFESTLQTAIRQGVRVKGMLLSNPRNPLGWQDVLCALLQFAGRYGLHVLMDEVYALSSHEPPCDTVNSPTFVSVLAIPDLAQYINPALVHVAYGMSKDFGMNGVRIGYLISPFNAEFRNVIQEIGLTSIVSSVAESAITTMLEDETWVDNYVRENRRRLGEAAQYTYTRLRDAGITCFPAKYGCYFWIDLSMYLRPPSNSAAEEASAKQLPATEQELYDRLLAAGIFLLRGANFYAAEPGWFRLTFSTQREVLAIGLDRLAAAVKQLREADNGHTGV
ncbi:pyridoxal phosphate-dependent transferase [Thamnocephalis sphaerospora]|uniref:Pyridoxal phosphate-dependent transferase n=1 Tax=Thamnocephalis sphaerospora TaxID=78915 RepID=A0A4P9XVX9_9FUNG|nr:pyridoxal phosphate-dependent transferase [Thamnocephalis sphaerospora]|eukprot:RKP10448.1 pyridoxal phosphate-dependent transferase [Thamnocephalis sphaerospora]